MKTWWAIILTVALLYMFIFLLGGMYEKTWGVGDYIIWAVDYFIICICMFYSLEKVWDYFTEAK